MNNFAGIGVIDAPEIKQSQGGTTFAMFTLKVARPVGNTMQQTEDVIPCICFGNTAQEIVGLAGQRVSVGGAVQSSTYTHPKFNKTSTKIQVLVTSVTKL